MDATCQFLKASAAICQAAWAIYGEDARQQSADKGHLTAMSTELRYTIQSLLDTRAVSNDGMSALHKACLKVGRDLVIRLDRAEEFIDNPRETWTQDAIEALAIRLVSLMRQYNASNPGSDVLRDERAFPCFRFTTPRKHQLVRDDKRQSQKQILYESQSSTDTFSPVPESLAIDVRVLKSSRPSQPRNAPVDLLNEFVLETLAFKDMYDREENVAKAHGKTFEWIFGADGRQGKAENEFRHGFSAWLETNNYGPIYWMTGKPGSGKSTLMKYLYEHPATYALIRKWAGSLPISSAGFFSWASGSKEQRSKSGLLRSLLYQFLSVNPHLIPRTFPNLWTKIRTMTSKERIALHVEWGIDELLEAFQLFMDAALSEMKICIFIDGLDEFEEDHQELTNFFKKYSLDGSVKMCLSSRPWNTFKAAFQTTAPSVKIQEITQPDLHQYATDRLRENPVVRRIMGRRIQETEALRQAIVDRADGVFLWIKLALNDILKDFDPKQGLPGSRDRLDQLPVELDGLYEKFLLQDQTDTQIAETATFFLLVEARETVAEFVNDTSASSLTVWELACAFEQDDDDYATDGDLVQASDVFIHERCSNTIECMHQRFAGLLSLQERQSQNCRRTIKFSDNVEEDSASIRRLAHTKVTFVHRTVRDWLRVDHVRRRLEQRISAGFDPHLRLLRSHVLRLKRPMEEIEHHRRFDEWWPDVTLAMTHSRYIINDTESMQRRLLNELNRTLSWLWDTNADPYDHWAAKAFGFFHVRKKAPPIWHPFLCLATKFGLTTYVAEELDAWISQGNHDVLGNGMPTFDDKATPLLTYATEFLCSRERSIYPLSDPNMVHNLLERRHPINPGPNHEYIDFETKSPMTSWVNLLRHLRDAHRRHLIGYFDTDPNGITRWAEIVRLFVRGGADVDAVVAADHWDPKISTVGVMELLADTYCAVELEEIKRLVSKE
ncbi:hypothetical protein AbraIFM66951_005823 [Aspergillus brasiliensis]|uniref:NACHT domain-containing protein n=1 Tax=Aspergillus brasiliensis TaxID=319629 RepID=A0A9W5Z2N1_9EURO|nr:hypothetical protein AbraCBS73388_002574 [Aspergillus brasiliensis]GKZ51475.1 hypothetical protein AbraIFM66951_005823 [Aspergillus brasiliensis]